MLGRLAVDGDVTVPLRAQAAALAAEIDFAARDYADADDEAKRAAELAPTEADGGRRWPSCGRWPTPAARETLGRALFGDELRPAGRRSGADLLPDAPSTRASSRPTRWGRTWSGASCSARDPARALPYLARACDDEAPTAVGRRCRPSSCASAGA